MTALRVSLNEIERLVERATRAAGAAPGADTEAGHFAAWLESRGLPGLAPLARALDRGPARALADGDVIDLGGASLVFHAGTLLDLALTRRSAGRALELHAARDPLFLLAAAADVPGTWLSWLIDDGGDHVARAAVGPDGPRLAAATAALAPEGPVRVRIDFGPTPALEALGLPDGGRGVAVNPDVWRRVGVYAARTYVPASALSRSRGAGAEVDDSA